MIKALQIYFDVRPGERLKTALMFFYFLLVITTIYILKPVRNALFIVDFGADKMKYMNLAEGVFLIFIVAAYSWLAKRISHRLFDVLVSSFLISNLCFFWFFSSKDIPQISAIFFLWQATFSVILTTQFWIFANDLFSASEAKRLFGIIISGGSIGGVFGGWLTQFLMRFTSIQNLFLVVSFILAACLFITFFLWKKVRHRPPTLGANEPHHDTEAKQKKSVVYYLWMIAGLVVLAKMTSTIIENQFAGVVEQLIVGKQALTAFYGGFYGWLNLFSFLMQVFLTARFLRRFGVSGSVWILPAGLAILSVWSVASSALITAVVYRLYDGSMNYSIHQASKEILYLPLSSAMRRRVKPWIDMLGFRGAKTLAGLYMIGAAALFSIPAHKYGILVLILIPLWLVVLLSIRNRLKTVQEMAP